MVARGEVGLVIVTILRGARVVDLPQYVIAVVVIVLTTVAAPIMLGIGFAFDTQEEENKDYILNIGLFSVIGTAQMFNIIIGRIEATNQFKTVIRLSEGRKIVNLQGHNVQVIYSPQEGIIFEGDRRKIKQLVALVENDVLNDIEGISEVAGG